jgi:2-aminoadipate transaminase
LIFARKRINKFKIEGSSGPFLTRMVERFAADGKLDTHISVLNKTYIRKRNVMLAAMKKSFPSDVRYEIPQGGFFIYCYLPADMPTAKVAAKAREHKVAFLPGAGCYANGQGQNEIRLAFSYQNDANISEGIARLGAAMHAVRAEA